jgi:hypothetical protein
LNKKRLLGAIQQTDMADMAKDWCNEFSRETSQFIDERIAAHNGPSQLA